MTDKEGNSLEIEDVKLNKDKKWLNITLKQEIEVGEAYYIKKEGFKSAIPVQYYEYMIVMHLMSYFTMKEMT